MLSLMFQHPSKRRRTMTLRIAALWRRYNAVCSRATCRRRLPYTHNMDSAPSDVFFLSQWQLPLCFCCLSSPNKIWQCMSAWWPPSARCCKEVNVCNLWRTLRGGDWKRLSPAQVRGHLQCTDTRPADCIGSRTRSYLAVFWHHSQDWEIPQKHRIYWTHCTYWHIRVYIWCVLISGT